MDNELDSGGENPVYIEKLVFSAPKMEPLVGIHVPGRWTRSQELCRFYQLKSLAGEHKHKFVVKMENAPKGVEVQIAIFLALSCSPFIEQSGEYTHSR